MADKQEDYQEGEIIIEEKLVDAQGKPVEVTAKTPASEPRSGASGLEGIASQVRELAQKIPESIGKAIETALSAREHVVMVRVNDESLTKLDHLVEAGIFKSRSESAAFLISEGIKAQSALFERISNKIEEINKLRNELKNIVGQEVNK
jgi:Arc/MetJ-type ribon-helix-helix transcriptional regulator